MRVEKGAFQWKEEEEEEDQQRTSAVAAAVAGHLCDSFDQLCPSLATNLSQMYKTRAAYEGKLRSVHLHNCLTSGGKQQGTSGAYYASLSSS